MKYQLCIVSHSHWDREWYLSHAEHNFRLVRFFDRLLQVLKSDEKFRSFHLDGQIIILEDYLEIRPEKKQLIVRLIEEGRLKIGPFYILQDEYLISGEANIRNLLVGLKECEKFGAPSRTGYFPDAFGNIGQMPQILRGFGLDNAFFGRGIIPAGYANEVVGKSEEGFSEIVWEGADGSKVIGVQFVNWYSNAMEIPTEPEACAARLCQIVKDSSLAARTPFLLGMNGCDHQPVQADLSRVFAIAEEAGIDAVHCTLEEYLQKILPYQGDFYNFRGEIEGQNGSGFGTLINTASSRVYLKQMNYRAQYLLETLAEPLSVIASANGIPCDTDLLYWLWKKLLQNHPHDSICGCGVDSVHKEMECRFAEVSDTARCLINELGQKLAQKACPAEGGILAVNCSCFPKSGYAECYYDFKEGERVLNNPVLLDERGEIVPAEIVDLGKMRVFELPEDKFRQVFEVTRYKITFLAEAEGASGRIYRLAEGRAVGSGCMKYTKDSMENEFVSVRFHENSTFDICSKTGGCAALSQNYFKEVGDRGNEYEFIRTGEEHDTLRDAARIRMISASPAAVKFEVENKLCQQNGETLAVTSEISLRKGERFARVAVRLENTCKDHRIRACFPCAFENGFHRAAGQFDLVKRKNEPGPRWQNENDPQRAEAFVERPCRDGGGMFVALRGLHEYEIGRDGATELTLLRCVGEMGDWFTFPTRDSQCLGAYSAEYAVGVFGNEDRESALLSAYDYHRPPFAAFAAKGRGEILRSSNARVEGGVVQSCLKKSEDGKGDVARVFNPFEEPQKIHLHGAVLTDMREENEAGNLDGTVVVPPKKIWTLRFKENMK